MRTVGLGAVLACGSVIACGRVDFAERTLATTDAPPGDGGPVVPVAWSKTFVGRIDNPTGGLLSISFVAAAAAAGDAVVVHLFCQNSLAPTAVTLTAPGWTFAQLAPIIGNTGTQFWGASVGAIAPDTASTTFTVTWAAPQNCSFLGELGDAFTGADPVSPFDTHAELEGTGNMCQATLITLHAGDAIWAACTANKVMATGAGYTKSADDADGDWSEYKVTSDPPNAIEQTTFAITAGAPFVITAVAIRPL